MWESRNAGEPQPYGSRGQPLIVQSLVIAGVSGADWGHSRICCSAYKASTGERVVAVLDNSK